jgi:outer membrane biosynthesis protein TonB
MTKKGAFVMRAGVLSGIVFGIGLAACAGRDPHPVAVVQLQDAQSDCAMIRAEIEANNVQAQKLAEENGAKIAQNVAAGVVGVVIWPVWFAMDAKGAAGTEMDALKARQQYLSSLAEQRCAPQPAPPPPPPHVAAKPKPKPKPAPPPAPAAAPAPPAAQSPN